MTSDLVYLVAEAVHGLLTEEIESFEVNSKPPPEERYPFPNDADMWLHLQVAGEWFDLTLTGDESSDELMKRLESNLQDWIAESRFAWGQRR